MFVLVVVVGAHQLGTHEQQQPTVRAPNRGRMLILKMLCGCAHDLKPEIGSSNACTVNSCKGGAVSGEGGGRVDLGELCSR